MRAIRQLGCIALASLAMLAAPAQAQRLSPLVRPSEYQLQRGESMDGTPRKFVFSAGANLLDPSDIDIKRLRVESGLNVHVGASLDYFATDRISVGTTYIRDERDLELRGAFPVGVKLRFKHRSRPLAVVEQDIHWIDNHVAYHADNGWSGQVGFTHVDGAADLVRLGGRPASGSFDFTSSSWNAWIYKRFEMKRGARTINSFVGAGYYFNDGFNAKRLYGGGPDGDGAASAQAGVQIPLGGNVDAVGSVWVFDFADPVLSGNVGVVTRF